ncbi:MAG TPA: DUF6076 domain-containing protein [Clostridiaceae bacterium]|nr:DUF6076 domain-containing protein [Clostridiaceae bacterium]
MKKTNDIKVAFNANLFVHSTTQIVGHYYKEYVEINENFENLSEDEYVHMMFAKIRNAKSDKERDKLGKEYADNMRKYYPYRKKYTTLSFNDNVGALDGYILFKIDTIEQQFDLSLFDFISYDFNNLNDYYLFFINHMDYFIDKFDKEDLNKIQFNKLYKIKDIIELARKYYLQERDNIVKYKKLFKDCINFCYQIDGSINLNNLTLQQRFFLFNQLYKNPFKDISNKFEIINLLDYTYDSIPYNSENVEPKDILILSSIIHTMDPEGKGLSCTFRFKTNNIFTAFYITLFNTIGMDELYVKICGNCNKYFITPKLNIVYCDREWANNLTCKDVGSKLSQKRKEEKNTIYGKYRTILSRKAMNAKRNPEIGKHVKDYEKYKKEANKFKKEIKEGKKTYNDFNKWLDTQDK